MTPQADHVSLEIIQRLCEGLLPELEQCAVEDHLAECEDCRGVFQRMDALLYRGFSAEAHAAAIRREAKAADPLIDALRLAASQAVQDTAAVLRRWLDSAAAVWGSGPVPAFGTFGPVPVAGPEDEEPIHIVLEPGTTRGRVRIAESRRAIQVQVSGGDKPGIVLLFHSESDSPPMLAPFETENGVHVARFSRVVRGDYLLALSPF